MRERHLLERARERPRRAAEERRLGEGALDVAANQEPLPPRRVEPGCEGGLLGSAEKGGSGQEKGSGGEGVRG